MREYILYVLLVFLPIAVLMFNLLQKEGIGRKNIGIIILISLLITVLFPISMQRLGTYVSLFLYIIVLLMLALYFVRTEGGYCLQAETAPLSTAGQKQSAISKDEEDLFSQQEELPENHIVVSDTVLDNSISSSEGLLESQGAEEPSEKSLEVNEEEYSPEEPVFEDDNDEIIININPEQQTDIQIEENDNKDNEAKEQENIQETANEASIIVEETDTRKDDDDQTMLKDFVEIDTSTLAEGEEDDLEYESSYNEENLVDSQKDESDEEKEIVDLEALQIKRDPVEEVIGLEVSDDIIKEEPADNDINNSSSVVENPKVLDLIEEGFACKYNNDLLGVGRKFREALDLTIDNELRYLLTVQLSDTYKDLALYKEAEEVLAHFLGFGTERPDIINEINHELISVRLLIQELERLGIVDIPVSRVPRWVKLKVAEEMKVQDIR